jgi:hypothetical protein
MLTFNTWRIELNAIEITPTPARLFWLFFKNLL